MRKEVIVILLLILISAAVLLWTRKTKDGFVDDVALNKIQDRANPLASEVNPRLNPSADYGILEKTDSPNDVDATYLRELNLAALNVPLEQRTDSADISMTPRVVRLSPRLDNENSFLGVVKFCKDTMNNTPTGKNPFDDPDFAKYCGVCMTSGSYITGENFNEFKDKKGAGVVVYQEDKDRAATKQQNNNYRYPRAVPSLDVGQCTGSSLANDEEPPVLAINSQMYYDMLQRTKCKEEQRYNSGHTCGVCKVDGTTPTWSYVKNPNGRPNTSFGASPVGTRGANNPITLQLWGVGKATVTVNGKQVAVRNVPVGAVTLDLESPKEWNLMSLQDGSKPIESDEIVVRMESINNGIAYFGGYLRGVAPPNNTETVIQIPNVWKPEGYSVGIGEPIYPSNGMPQGQRKLDSFALTPDSNNPFSVKFYIPITLIGSEWDKVNPQIAYYDCKNNPYLTSEESADAFLDDQCAKDEKRGMLTSRCLQQILTDQKCSSAGDWWGNLGSLATAAGAPTKDAVVKYIQTIRDTQPIQYSKLCLGRDTSSKCDPYFANPNDTNISPECLWEVYNNRLSTNPRLAEKGVVYTEKFVDSGFFSKMGSLVGSWFGANSQEGFEMTFQSLDTNTPQFCRPEGSLNPKTDKNNRLKIIAENGYVDSKGVRYPPGIDSVKKKLQDTYHVAIDSSRSINVADKDGGRMDSWNQCFGIALAAPKTVNVRTTKAPSELMLASSAPFTSTTTRPIGNPVYVAGAAAEVDSNGNFGWATGNWVRNAPPKGNKCYWIGSDPNYYSKVADGKVSTFKFNFVNPYGFEINNAMLVGSIDNIGTIKLNNQTLTHSNGKTTIYDSIPGDGIPVKILGMNSTNNTVPQNEIEVRCENTSGAHCLWLAIYATIGGEKKYIMTTNENWVYV